MLLKSSCLQAIYITLEKSKPTVFTITLKVVYRFPSTLVCSFSNHRHIIGHFGDESFQSITCTGTDNLTRTTKRQNTQITLKNNTT